MAGISKRLWIYLFVTGALVPLAHANEPPRIHAVDATAVHASDAPPVSYDIGLELKNNEVKAITVRATMRIGNDGVVDFDPPRQRPNDVHAEGGHLDTSAGGNWHVTGAPGAEVVLTWRSPKPERLSVGGSAWDAIVAQPGNVLAFDVAILAIPKGPPTRSVTVTTSLPSGWQGSSNMTDGSSNVARLPNTSFVASRNLYTVTRPINATRALHVASIGVQAKDADRVATQLAATLRSIQDTIRVTGPKDTAITLLVSNEGDAYRFSVAGASATLLLSRYDPAYPWLFGLAQYLSLGDDTPGNAANAWYTRGFTGYRVASAMLASGFFDNKSFARHVDQTLNAYGGSPLRRASNANVAEEYDRIREMHDLPEARGELFAWLLDARIRKATQGRKRLYDALERVDRSSVDPGHELIAAVAAEGGGDITSLYQRYIVEGDLLQLPPDTLGPCFSIGTVVYDYGWQVQHVFARPPSQCAGPAPVGADSSAMGPPHG
jgi:hypothetical protein